MATVQVVCKTPSRLDIVFIAARPYRFNEPASPPPAGLEPRLEGPEGGVRERDQPLCIAIQTKEADMLFNPMLPFIIYQRWLETVVLPYLNSFESRYARDETDVIAEEHAQGEPVFFAHAG